MMTIQHDVSKPNHHTKRSTCPSLSAAHCKLQPASKALTRRIPRTAHGTSPPKLSLSPNASPSRSVHGSAAAAGPKFSDLACLRFKKGGDRELSQRLLAAMLNHNCQGLLAPFQHIPQAVKFQGPSTCLKPQQRLCQVPEAATLNRAKT